MNKIWLIIKREYLIKVKKRSFIVMTFLGPLLFAGLLFGAIFITLNDQTTYEVLVVDFNGVISQKNDDGTKLISRFPDRFESDPNSVMFGFSNLDVSDEDFKQGPYNVMIKVDDSALNTGKCDLYFKRLPGEIAMNKISSELEEALERYRVTDSLKLDYDRYKRIKVDVVFNRHDIDKLTEVDRTQEKGVIGFAFALLIYLFIFLYGVQVMRGVMEEKQNRIVEVIISSVKPFQLMMGKVIGIGLVGLTQFVMWIVLSGVVSTIGLAVFAANVDGEAVVNGLSQANAAAGQINAQELMNNEAINWFFTINWPLMIGLFLFYFIGGYLLYGSLFAAIGASVDSETDTQQFMMPVTIPLIFAYIVSVMMLSNPESEVGTFFAIFPLTSPIVMMVKASIGTSPWILTASIIMLILAFLFFIWLAARIYRVGILMYGKKPTFRELWKWIRFSS